MKKMSLDELIDSIQALAREVRSYEKKYGLASEDFYELFRQGKLDDGEPEQTEDFCLWAGLYEMKPGPGEGVPSRKPGSGARTPLHRQRARIAPHTPSRSHSLMLCSLEAYARFIHSLPKEHSSIQSSTLVLYTIGPHEVVVKGELRFARDITLRVAEAIDLARGVIRRYSYTISQGDAKLYWYDPQPHPDAPSLTGTFPITSTYPRTSSTTVFLPHKSVLTNLTCLSSSKRSNAC